MGGLGTGRAGAAVGSAASAQPMVQNGLQKNDITNERKEIIMKIRQSSTRWLGLALAWLAVALLASTGTVPAQTIPGRYIAVLKAETRDTPGTANALAAQHGLQLDHVYTKAIKGFAFAGAEPAAQALARRTEVAYVEPDQVYTAFQQTVPTGIRRCDADAVPGLITGGNVTIDADVAVIDTGLDATHPDLNVQAGRRPLLHDQEDHEDRRQLAGRSRPRHARRRDHRRARQRHRGRGRRARRALVGRESAGLRRRRHSLDRAGGH